jgi:hypothetical protein
MQYKLEEHRGMRIYYNCPGCLGEKVFVRYVYLKTGVQVADNVGECTAKKKECGYHYSPFEYFRDKRILPNPKGVNAPPSYIPYNQLTKSSTRYHENNFVIYLRAEFGDDATKSLVERYRIGTSNICKGGVIFWHIDREGHIRTGRLFHYNLATGNEMRYPYSIKRWVHSYYSNNSFNLVHCFFGEHLIMQEPTKTIIVVYNEKEAIIGSHFYPEYLWLALCDGGSVPNSQMLQTLSNRKVIWFPESGFEKIARF